MLFPAAERVIYTPNPLDNVICQVRFPTILRIDTELPSAFQEKMIPDYVDLTEGEEVIFEVQVGGKSVIPREDLGQGASLRTKNYEFASDDKKWKVNLTRNFLSLSTSGYTQWEDFKTRFDKVLKVFVELYKPLVFTRVGLRYVDIIRRSRLGLQDVDWSELIQPSLLGLLGYTAIKSRLKQIQSVAILATEVDASEVRLVTGTVESTENSERWFMVDSDFYDLKRRKADELMVRLEAFHSEAYGLFRWCITDRLHSSMNPKRLA